MLYAHKPYHLDIGLDPGFKEFYYWCKDNGVPFVIVSRYASHPNIHCHRGLSLTLHSSRSGMEPTIRAVLSNLLPKEDADSIDVIANGVHYTDPEGKGTTWDLVYRHPESHYGHDKSKAILPYRDLPNKPTLIFCGDGVSGAFRTTVPRLGRCFN